MSRKSRKKKPKKTRPAKNIKSVGSAKLYHLDTLNIEDLEEWSQASSDLETYWVSLFYHLEGLRDLHNEEIIYSLQQSNPESIKLKNWARIVDYQYSNSPLSAKGSMINGGRFNVGRDINNTTFSTFPALYLATNYQTAFFEKFGGDTKSTDSILSGNELALRTIDSFSYVKLNGELFNLFNLKKTNNLRRFVNIIKIFDIPAELKNLADSLKINAPYTITKPSQLKDVLLAGNWREWPFLYNIPSNPQIFGRLLLRAGYDGILYPSTKGNHDCIALFLENFTASQSYIELTDSTPPGVLISRLDSSTWKTLI